MTPADPDSVSLREFMERVLAERELRYMQMFRSAGEAVEKAESALREYKALANEFRGTLKDQAVNLMPRTEAENRFSQQAERIRALELAERAGEGGSKATKEARSNSQWVIGLIVGIALSAFGVLVARLK